MDGRPTASAFALGSGFGVTAEWIPPCATDKWICRMINHVEPSASFGGSAGPAPRSASKKLFPAQRSGAFDNRMGSPRAVISRSETKEAFTRGRAGLTQFYGRHEILVTVCAWCSRSIQKGEDRFDAGSWKPVEQARFEANGISMTHGICPACMKKVCLESNLTYP